MFGHRYIFSFSFSLVVFLAPILVFAQNTTGQTDTLADILATATQVVTLAVPVAGLLLLFFWSMFQVISNAGDAEKLKKARSKILWGLIALFVVLSLGGLIAVLQMTFFRTVIGP